MSQAVDLLVDGRVLLDVGVGLGDVSFWLVVVVVGDEVVDGVVGEELLELVVQLGGEGFIVSDDQGGFLHVLDHVSYGECLPRSGRPEQRLVPKSLEHTLGKLRDGLGLVALGAERGHELEALRGLYFRHPQKDYSRTLSG